MTDNNRYDYNVYCLTESKWVSGTTRSSVKPTACFNNNSHSIDASVTTLTGTVGPTTVIMAEEDIPTGGNYKCKSVPFTAAAATVVDGVTVPTVTTHDFSFPYPINLLSTSAVMGDEHSGNSIDVYFIPDTIIGANTQVNGVNSDSQILVAPNTLSYCIVGLQVGIRDAQGSESLGVVAAVDANTATVTVSGDPQRAYTRGSTLILSYSEASGALAADAIPATPTVITVNPELAAAAFVGLVVRVDGVLAGTISEISGTVITVTGTLADTVLAGAAVVLSSPTVEIFTTDDVLPIRVIEVTDSAVLYAQIGMSARITDGTYIDNLGSIIAVDKATRRITVEIPPTRTWAPGCYIQVTRYFIENMEFSGRATYGFSSTRNKGSYVEAGRTGRFAYTNRTTIALRFVMKLEFLL